MAETAVGGFQAGVKVRRTRPAACAHPLTLSVVSAGIERVVCEGCGHLSVHFLTELTGPIDRTRFARPADTLHLDGEGPENDTGQSSILDFFAREERLHVRSRYQAYPVPASVPA